MTNYVLPDEIRTPEIGGFAYVRYHDGRYGGRRGEYGTRTLESIVADSWTREYVYFEKPTDDETNLIAVKDQEGDVWSIRSVDGKFRLRGKRASEVSTLSDIENAYGVREYVYSEPARTDKYKQYGALGEIRSLGSDENPLRKPQPGDRVRVTFEGTYSKLHSNNGLHWVDRGDGNALVPAESVTVLEPAKPEIPAEPGDHVRAVLGASGELYLRNTTYDNAAWESETSMWTWPELVKLDGPLACVARGEEIK